MERPQIPVERLSTRAGRGLSARLGALALALASAAPLAAQSTIADATADARLAAAARRTTVPARARLAPRADSLLAEAQADLLGLPPLGDLLAAAAATAPHNRQIALAQAQEVAREQGWRLADFDLVTFQAVGITGRRDVFAVNTDGSVFVPTASTVDNLNMQASVSLKVNPVSFFQNAKQREVRQLERDRLEAVREEGARSVAEGVIYAYNMAQKSLDVMDARAGALRLVESRAELAEQLFRQGAMTLADYAEFQSKAADMAAKFSDSRGDFRLYYQTLMARVYGELP